MHENYDENFKAAQRSFTMSQIKGKGTSIEVRLQKALWHSGIRYRKNYKRLPGSPDIAITKYKIAIFCDGEFWHGKDWSIKRNQIKSNTEYWIRKIEGNMNRDQKYNAQLEAEGWTVLRFWGNDIKGHIWACVMVIKNVIDQAQNNERNDDLSSCYGFTEIHTADSLKVAENIDGCYTTHNNETDKMFYVAK